MSTTEETRKAVIALMDCQRNKDVAGFQNLVTDDFYVRVPGHAELLPWRVEVKGKDQSFKKWPRRHRVMEVKRLF